jgi:O-methyltransferase
MLTSIFSRARHWLTPTSRPVSETPLCVPEWSEPMAERHASIWWKVKPYTMTSVERVVALCQSIAYLENHRIPGAIVECGVWRGGSMMAAALSLLALESTQRQLYFFDTFEGMPAPTDVDVDWHGRAARDLMRHASPEAEMIRAKSSLAEVQQAMMLTRYPWEKLRFVPGRVEETLPKHAPRQIALLRLDTDWYESTYHELEHLYPSLVDDGILIVDDYGHWQGARKAVDDYFRRQGLEADLRTIDFTGRLMLKKASPRVLSRAG